MRCCVASVNCHVLAISEIRAPWVKGYRMRYVTWMHIHSFLKCMATDHGSSYPSSGLAAAAIVLAVAGSACFWHKADFNYCGHAPDLCITVCFSDSVLMHVGSPVALDYEMQIGEVERIDTLGDRYHVHVAIRGKYEIPAESQFVARAAWFRGAKTWINVVPSGPPVVMPSGSVVQGNSTLQLGDMVKL